jgi:hypothetical protein
LNRPGPAANRLIDYATKLVFNRRVTPRWRLTKQLLIPLALMLAVSGGGHAIAAENSRPGRVMIEQYCLDCHDGESKKGELDLTVALGADLAAQPEVWEQVVRRLATRQMPPATSKSRPSEKEFDKSVAALTASLDAEARARPRPGRSETFRRLNRTEYQNAIRDLLALEIDAAALLPKDDASHGFDNVGIANLSPTLLNRYIAAAEKISRRAVGAALREAWEEVGLAAIVT